MLRLDFLYDLFCQYPSISTDTRKIKPNDLFFALSGENFDGNAFAAQALEKGAAYAIVDNPQYKSSEKCLLVENTLKTLQDLAILHRKKFSFPVLGITGSNGKTTTKELITKVLQKKYTLLATQGNLNNHIGVPLTILQMKPQHQLAVIELGGNHIGEVADLCRFAQPTHALITNVGEDHLEGFGSLEGVIKALQELYDFVIDHQGTGIIDGKDAILTKMGQNFTQKIIYGIKNSFSYLQFIEANPFISYSSEDKKRVQTQVMGRYNLDNIEAAVCVGKLFSVEAESIHEAIADYVPSNNRSQLVKGEHNWVVLDAYNANPSSMREALQSFSQSFAGQKIAILGDMYELGSYSEEKHREIIDFASQLALDLVIFCGKNFQEVIKKDDTFACYASKTDLTEWLKNHPFRNAHILLKASRGMGMETLLEWVK